MYTSVYHRPLLDISIPKLALNISALPNSHRASTCNIMYNVHRRPSRLEDMTHCIWRHAVPTSGHVCSNVHMSRSTRDNPTYKRTVKREKKDLSLPFTAPFKHFVLHLNFHRKSIKIRSF